MSGNCRRRGDHHGFNDNTYIQKYCTFEPHIEVVGESRGKQLMVNISEKQYIRFQSGKSTIQPLFCLRRVQKGVACGVCGPGKQEKAYDMVPMELIWYLLRRKGVPEAYINIIREIISRVQDKRHDQCGRDQRD